MPYCIKASEFSPDIHVKISGPHTLSECQQICGVSSLSVPNKGCGCSQKQPAELFDAVENVNG